MAQRKQRKTGDHYTARAKKEGYPARSVYKLEEMDRKDGLIPRDGKVLDVGSAPGSWSLYALRKMGDQGRVTAVDLQDMTLRPDPRLTFFQGDVFSPEARVFLEAQGPFDLVMSDAAPATTGNRTLDTGRSADLAQCIVDLASRHLVPGGKLVIKIFQGGAEQEIFKLIQSRFDKAKRFTPQAVRKESFETYLLGIGKKEEPHG